MGGLLSCSRSSIESHLAAQVQWHCSSASMGLLEGHKRSLSVSNWPTEPFVAANMCVPAAEAEWTHWKWIHSASVGGLQTYSAADVQVDLSRAADPLRARRMVADLHMRGPSSCQERGKVLHKKWAPWKLIGPLAKAASEVQ